MRNFVKGLLTNRFGIVLAALNVCYFASRSYIHFIFAHAHGENCAFFGGRHFFDIFTGLGAGSSDFMFLLNLPAVLFSLLSGTFVQIIFPDFCLYTQGKIQIVFFVFFITFQWLFIGWTAKTLAGKIQLMKS